MIPLRSTLPLVVCLFSLSVASAQTADDFELSIPSVSGSVGGTADVSFTLTNVSTAGVLGYQWGACHDASMLTLVDGDVVQGTAIDSFGFTFEAVTVFADGVLGGPGWTVGGIFDVLTATQLPPGILDELYVATYSLEAAGVAEIDWCEALNDPVVNVRVLYSLGPGSGAAEIEPVQLNGEVTIGSGFRRGDADGSGTVEPLVDALFILDWAFLAADAPGCLDAVDVNDDGSIIPTADAIYLLNFGFSGGPAPPAPGVDVCDEDPTDDTLTCVSPGDCT